MWGRGRKMFSISVLFSYYSHILFPSPSSAKKALDVWIFNLNPSSIPFRPDGPSPLQRRFWRGFKLV